MKKNDSKAIHLANRLWSIANDLRGNMDSIKFKNYILGIIFYRYLSERTESYINNLPQSFIAESTNCLNDTLSELGLKEI